MLDFLEYLEAGAEARLDEMTQGLPEGKFKCDCGKIEDLGHAAPSGLSPYSAPMCRECLQRMEEENKPAESD